MIRRALLLAAAAGAAHTLIVGAIEGLGLAAVTAALAASVAFALINSIGPSLRVRPAGHTTPGTEASATVSQLTIWSASLVTALVTVLVALGLATMIFGQMADFYCAPAVPWRIEIAIFGAFAVALLKHLAHRLRYANALDVLIYVSLFWIAPFYGFFSPAYFLALNIVTPCPGRQLIEVLLAAAAMAVACALAETVGTFLSKGR